MGTVQPVPNTKCVYLASTLSIGTDIALGELVVGPPMFTFPKNFNLESVAAASNLWVQFYPRNQYQLVLKSCLCATLTSGWSGATPYRTSP